MQITIHAKIIVINTDGNLLLLKRSYGNKMRDLPGGAVVLPETIEEGLMREIKEETGLTHIHSLQMIECISSYDKDEDKYVVFLGYKGTTPEHAIHLSEEHEEYMWTTKDAALEKGLTPYLLEFIRKHT